MPFLGFRARGRGPPRHVGIFFPARRALNRATTVRAAPIYAITVRYEEAERMLRGVETITWTNESRDDVPDLWFHLYWNAFANELVDHHQSVGRANSDMKDGEWGWTRITSLVVGDQEIAPSIELRLAGRQAARGSHGLPRQAAEGRAARRRRHRARHVGAKIPRLRRRTGYKDDFLFIAQWFPKLGVYETGNGGTATSSTATPSSSATTARMTSSSTCRRGTRPASELRACNPIRRAPARAASKCASPRRPEKDRVTPDPHRQAAARARLLVGRRSDFAAVRGHFPLRRVAQRYEEEVDRVALALGRSPSEMRLRDVHVTVILQPDHYDQGQRHFDATCTALFFYGLWFGEYPYEHITCVDPAVGRTRGGRDGVPDALHRRHAHVHDRPDARPESVDVHECGHQFWYGLVGNNEFEAAWLDEGFNTLHAERGRCGSTTCAHLDDDRTPRFRRRRGHDGRVPGARRRGRRAGAGGSGTSLEHHTRAAARLGARRLVARSAADVVRAPAHPIRARPIAANT
jgi:hypothetical protein